jgi:hypothetical protein
MFQNLPVTTLATTLVPDVSYIGLYSCVERSSLVIDHSSGPLKVADSTIVKKWKWLFVNICECKSRMSRATEFFNPYIGEVGDYAQE